MKQKSMMPLRSLAQKDASKTRILILGGGFAGAYTAAQLEKRLATNVEVVVVAKENFVLFTPMLHEVAGSDVSVTDIVQPLRKMLRRSHIGIADVEAIDLLNKHVRVRHPDLPAPIEVPYDHLVLALGAVTNFFKTPGLAYHVLTMKTLGDDILSLHRVLHVPDVAHNHEV